MRNRLSRGEVTAETMDRIAEILADFYQRAETGVDVNRFGAPDTIRFNTDENFRQTEDYIDVALSRHRFETIRGLHQSLPGGPQGIAWTPHRWRFHSRLPWRSAYGPISCLGDKVWIFDCIEFNERFRYSDVASDLAFLAMDLDYHGRPDLGQCLIESYEHHSGDLEAADRSGFLQMLPGLCPRQDQLFHLRPGKCSRIGQAKRSGRSPASLHFGLSLRRRNKQTAPDCIFRPDGLGQNQLGPTYGPSPGGSANKFGPRTQTIGRSGARRSGICPVRPRPVPHRKCRNVSTKPCMKPLKI